VVDQGFGHLRPGTVGGAEEEDALSQVPLPGKDPRQISSGVLNI
jgi:hypothetical protein